MLMSVTWMNDYLDPPASEEEQGELLTAAGFPLEERHVFGDEVALDFEMMSNRGDCTCHVGLAREIAAISQRTLQLPSSIAEETGDPIEDHVQVINEAPDACPLYTARVIRGIQVAPSSDDIRMRLESRGEIPRNNIVDASNYVLFELGQPTHAFDLDKLAGGKVIIRFAREGETFLPLGEDATEITLKGTELVIADADKPIALAGVKGGAATAVTESTRNILLEAATFDPVLVRQTSRLHNISSDSSYRFERGVSPLQIDESAQRLAHLILQHAGGTLCKGMIAAGAALPELHSVSMRPERYQTLIGRELSEQDMLAVLDRLGFQPRQDDNRISTTVPCFRGDIHREIDLIEEVARMQGYDELPVTETFPIRLATPEPAVTGRRAINDQLIAEGFIETVSHTLVNEKLATPFITPGCSLLRTIDEREHGDTLLRPSLLPSLLRVRGHNLDRGATSQRLYEIGSAFQECSGNLHESRRIGLLLDLKDTDEGLRPLRGVVDGLLDRTGGPTATLDIRASDALPWYAPGAELRVNDQLLGHAGILSQSVTTPFGIDHVLLAAEIELDELLAAWPPDYQALELPNFPTIQRDISAIVSEDTTWAQVSQTIDELELESLETIEFVTVFRDDRIGADRKSLTLRLRFRSADRTLTHDEIDGPVDRAIDALQQQLGAEIRS